MQICQIAGYKRSGKTTLINQLIRYFSETGLNVGSLKHHGHGGEPDMRAGTDSQQHLESGSVISGVQGENLTQLTLNTPFELKDLIEMYSKFSLDVLLVEGYKTYEYPKIVLIRHETDLSLLHELSNIIAVGAWDMDIVEDKSYPIFDMTHLQKDRAVIAEQIRRGANG
ncbi:molybdopterin-guanine dinucleotide biosynthesis protein B [Lentibacillus amyloliquefaciens]|uniref:Molybdopterin-guanine dinucleotide biosynthesis protein B (MobB) domain-containing protein n=1 Tax=Lentibacillus amyloliquefaciens TaxID=1472767 RepID=A0A0U4FS02_9BACI|nr:molybdopterin-guanine dinucleotide biosynthesis protein B [Lentibacillus amyloliquefaciens]ALX48661.1 hypothetical protein AOX59_08585 [Lentibacillus amyloliquefaciens]